jgi:hypothetical protein
MKILLLLAAFCISINGFSQKGDYLIKNNGDTVWGDIKLKDKIFYVNGASQAAIKADDVTRIKSENYKGNIVVHCNLQTYTDNLGDLEIDYIQKGVTDTVLILDEIYTTPKINLYHGINNFRTQFYFYKTPTDPKPVQLVIRYFLQGGLANYNDDRARYRGDRSKVQIVEDKGYVNQLHAIMGDCKKIPYTMWELLSYRDYSLKQVIKKYNKCN